MRAVSLLISGRVQKVGYRWWTVGTARRLRLTGWVRNLRDGRVEVLAFGPPARIVDLINACHHGPDAAMVEAVAVEEVAVPTELVGFEQRPTV